MITKPVGLLLLKVFAFLSVFSSFSLATSLQAKEIKSVTKSFHNQNQDFNCSAGFDRIKDHTKVFIEESEVLEIDEVTDTNKNRSIYHQNSYSLLLQQQHSTKKQQRKLYITFCCLRIHLV
ncbi:MAG: hypothetical protein JNL36_11375 [Candidatus Kapabacteria bacterium]|nr:hypothetical protein [Candidatus Kapabacteria bacterium]